MRTVQSECYKSLLKWLASKRLLAGVTQQELSTKLIKPQSFVSKYENGERRLDIIETIEICTVLNVDPHELISVIKGGKY